MPTLKQHGPNVQSIINEIDLHFIFMPLSAISVYCTLAEYLFTDNYAIAQHIQVQIQYKTVVMYN